MSDQPFIAYWDAVDAAMRSIYGIDTGDTGLTADDIAAHQEAGDTPEQVVRDWGEDYGLATLAEALGYGGGR